jgi:hypothetical protein
MRRNTPERFRLRIIMLYTGARLEEIAQFATRDVRQANGIWTLHLTAENNLQPPMNQSGRRVIPIHSAIVVRDFSGSLGAGLMAANLDPLRNSASNSES